MSPLSAARRRSAAVSAARWRAKRAPGDTRPERRQAAGENGTPLHGGPLEIPAAHGADALPAGERRRGGAARPAPDRSILARAAMSSGLPGARRPTSSQSPRAPSRSPCEPADVAALEQGRGRMRRLGQCLVDIGARRVEAVERTIGRSAVDQRVDPVGIDLQHTVEIGDGAIEIADRGRRLGAVDQRSGSSRLLAIPPRRPLHRPAPGRRRAAKPAQPGRAHRRAAPSAPSSSRGPRPAGGLPPLCICRARSARPRRNARPDARRRARARPGPGSAPRAGSAGRASCSGHKSRHPLRPSAPRRPARPDPPPHSRRPTAAATADGDTHCREPIARLPASPSPRSTPVPIPWRGVAAKSCKRLHSPPSDPPSRVVQYSDLRFRSPVSGRDR